MRCSLKCSKSNLLGLIKWQYWLFFLTSSRTAVLRSSTALLHYEDLLFIHFPRDPTLWNLSNHGLFLQGCMVLVANTHESHHTLLQMKHDLLCPLSLTHKLTEISAKKAYTKQNILLLLLTDVGRWQEKTQLLSCGKNLISSSWKRDAGVRFVKLKNCKCVSTRLDKTLIQLKVPVPSSGQ